MHPVRSQVRWLGEHPKLPDVVGALMPLHNWKVTPYERTTRPATGLSSQATAAIERLRSGNARFLRGETLGAPSSGEINDPFAIVIGGAEKVGAIERVFDMAPGDLVVQRCMGGIAGRSGATLFDSIEYAVVRFAPKLLLVLGEADSEVRHTLPLPRSGGPLAAVAAMRGPWHSGARFPIR